MSSATENPNNSPDQKPSAEALKQKIELSAKKRAEKTRHYFEATDKSLDDFVINLAKEPWEIIIDKENDRSLTLGIFTLQQKLGFKEALSSEGCDGVCGPYTFKEYAKAKMLFENKNLQNRIKEEVEESDPHALMDAAIKRGIKKSNYGGDTDKLIQAVEYELNSLKKGRYGEGDVKYSGGSIIGNFNFGIDKSDNGNVAISITQVTQEEKDKYPDKPIAKIPTLKGRYGDKYQKREEQARRLISKIQDSPIAPELKKIIDTFLSEIYKKDPQAFQAFNEAKLEGMEGLLILMEMYLSLDINNLLKFKNGEIHEIDILKTIFEKMFAWAEKTHEPQKIEILRKQIGLFFEEEETFFNKAQI